MDGSGSQQLLKSSASGVMLGSDPCGASQSPRNVHESPWLWPSCPTFPPSVLQSWISPSESLLARFQNLSSLSWCG